MAYRDIRIGASSNVKAVRYDPDTMTLAVDFQAGGTYTYDQVPSTVADGFSQAESPGKYVFAALRGRYMHKKIG